MAEDEAVVHVEIEEPGEAESEEVAPDHIPFEQYRKELQEQHLDDESPDATAEISGVMGAERVETAVRNPVAPNEEVSYCEIG